MEANFRRASRARRRRPGTTAWSRRAQSALAAARPNRLEPLMEGNLGGYLEDGLVGGEGDVLGGLART